MKFWEKIFLCILITFEIFFIPSCIYLFNSSFKLNLNEEIDSAVNEHYRVCSSIESNLFLLKNQQDSYKMQVDKQNIDSMINRYLDGFGKQNVCFNIVDEKEKVIFSNLDIDIPEFPEELNTSQNKVNYIIQDVNDKTYMFITKKINLDNNYYEVSYVKDISNTYNNRKYLLNLLLKLNLVVSIVLVIVTIILSKFIVNPINKLIKSTKTIASGEFSERVQVSSHDEVGILSKHFNDMADVVEDKINELQRASEDKQRFIDNLAHELRTPLTSIIGYSDYLRTNQYNEEIFIDCLTFIYDAGKRLEKLSFTLMDLIILRKDKFQIKAEKIDLLLIAIKNDLSYKLEEKNIELEIVCEELVVAINESLIRILINNLVDNSIKASKLGSKIYIKAYKESKSDAILEIKDNGIGIPKEEIDKIFEPFFMVDKSRERANGGVGLGLSLCAQIAKIHNAKISVDSELDNGTTIRVKFTIG
ncbi:HAMP domain-containing histidine kinase [Clostridium sp. SHJSY1]|uniref:HAMP domain-containing sensor histidine kinase n=1 Tax=Clostridium sp. SHJSY1 TaxID=2942483 RepID=UPI0028769579|nr:HAMP domain-containing sensor histidine kinase [Clostridium sp. SHJSY1]MDS0524200.1 HAMP domain-containing histidine kinase [Clostridium sp. SHJSY1]